MNSKLTKGIVKSSWTPLNNEEVNNKVFEERRCLVNKWFEQWNTSQRKLILEELLMKCTGKQTDFARDILSTKAAQNHVDFSRCLPRILCLYIFTFLDPRSLCRASQVCWYWKYLSESNEIWAPKCIRLGWYFNGPLNTIEQGLWKKHFIYNVIQLQISRPNKNTIELSRKKKQLTALELARMEKEEEEKRIKRLKEKHLKAQQNGMKPWKGPDPKPIDIVRNNYIENDFENGAKLKMIRPDSHNVSNYGRRLSNEKNSKSQSIIRPISAHSKKVNSDRSIKSATSKSNKTTLDNGDSISINSDALASVEIKDMTNGQGDGINHNDNVQFTTIESEIPKGTPWILPTDIEEEAL